MTGRGEVVTWLNLGARAGGRGGVGKEGGVHFSLANIRVSLRCVSGTCKIR